MNQVSEMSIDNDKVQATNNAGLVTQGWIFFSTFLGGPLAGCYLIGRNYRVLGLPENAKIWYWGGIISTILLVIILIAIPSEYMKHVPNSMIPIIYTVSISSLYRNLQATQIKQKLKDGWGKYPWYKILGIAMLSFLILMAILFIAVFFIQPK